MEMQIVMSPMQMQEALPDGGTADETGSMRGKSTPAPFFGMLLDQLTEAGEKEPSSLFSGQAGDGKKSAAANVAAIIRGAIPGKLPDMVAQKGKGGVQYLAGKPDTVPDTRGAAAKHPSDVSQPQGPGRAEEKKQVMDPSSSLLAVAGNPFPVEMSQTPPAAGPVDDAGLRGSVPPEDGQGGWATMPGNTTQMAASSQFSADERSIDIRGAVPGNLPEMFVPVGGSGLKTWPENPVGGQIQGGPENGRGSGPSLPVAGLKGNGEERITGPVWASRYAAATSTGDDPAVPLAGPANGVRLSGEALPEGVPAVQPGNTAQTMAAVRSTVEGAANNLRGEIPGKLAEILIPAGGRVQASSESPGGDPILRQMSQTAVKEEPAGSARPAASVKGGEEAGLTGPVWLRGYTKVNPVIVEDVTISSVGSAGTVRQQGFTLPEEQQGSKLFDKPFQTTVTGKSIAENMVNNVKGAIPGKLPEMLMPAEGRETQALPDSPMGMQILRQTSQIPVKEHLSGVAQPEVPVKSGEETGIRTPVWFRRFAATNPFMDLDSRTSLGETTVTARPQGIALPEERPGSGLLDNPFQTNVTEKSVAENMVKNVRGAIPGKLAEMPMPAEGSETQAVPDSPMGMQILRQTSQMKGTEQLAGVPRPVAQVKTGEEPGSAVRTQKGALPENVQVTSGASRNNTVRTAATGNSAAENAANVIREEIPGRFPEMPMPAGGRGAQATSESPVGVQLVRETQVGTPKSQPSVASRPETPVPGGGQQKISDQPWSRGYAVADARARENAAIPNQEPVGVARPQRISMSGNGWELPADRSGKPQQAATAAATEEPPANYGATVLQELPASPPASVTNPSILTGAALKRTALSPEPGPSGSGPGAAGRSGADASAPRMTKDVRGPGERPLNSTGEIKNEAIDATAAKGGVPARETEPAGRFQENRMSGESAGKAYKGVLEQTMRGKGEPATGRDSVPPVQEPATPDAASVNGGTLPERIEMVFAVEEAAPGNNTGGTISRKTREGKTGDAPVTVSGSPDAAPVRSSGENRPAAPAAGERNHSAESIFNQVKEKLDVAGRASDNGRITLKLHPEELGELKINVQLKDHGLKVEVVTQNPSVKEALMQNIDSLKDTLSRQNIAMERFDVSADPRQGLHQGGRDERQMSQGERVANGGAQYSEELEEDAPAAQNYPWESENSLVNLML